MVVRVALVLVMCVVHSVAFAASMPEEAVSQAPAARPASSRATVLQLTPTDYGMTLDASVGTHVMARLSGIVTFYFDRARLSGQAVKNVYVSGGPGSYVVWFRVMGEGESSLHLPFFSVDEQTKALGGLDVTVKAAPVKTTPAEPLWIELPTSPDRNTIEVEVPAGNTIFVAWPLAHTADVLNGVEVSGAAVEKLMDPRWMHVLGEHEGEWLVTMVEAISPGTAVIKFGNGKMVTIRVKRGDIAVRPGIDKSI